MSPSTYNNENTVSKKAQLKELGYASLLTLGWPLGFRMESGAKPRNDEIPPIKK